ncbi:hypothetical protein B2J86_15620 [Acidovorax sp. SRB_14]|uniref:DUF2868 domain-containing protein n=1 Tax=Acidovorax sp. SRB_14 TaxID=1962699 RepID=UPI00146CAD9E|nr:DUF2868 domain-containing protein [Acidovorax sp. SRB_14]NMM82340.1 hypothetical protein [Acidovorax sp. SRB_14]NMM90342.1 hypothetical protein [Rhodococcus sp. SRB_17]
MAPASRSPLAEVWMALAVRGIEQDGPLDDAHALAEAARLQAAPQQRLRERAWLLGERLGLVAQMARWREAAWLLGAALAVAVVLLANGLVLAMLTDARSINAGSALVAALGVHAFTLLLWLVALLLPGRSGPGAWGRLSFGPLLLQALARLPMGPRPQAQALARAAAQMLQRARLAPWAFGLVSHLVWSAAFVLVLGALWLAFAFREYRLTWETTILSADLFAAFVQATGRLPGLLGFPVSEVAGRASAQAPLVLPARAAAWWLLGCVTVYGLLPRLLCAALCAVVWQRRKGRIQIDTSDPYFSQLLARFAALQPGCVTDAEHPAPQGPASLATLAPGAAGQALAVVGFELPQGQDWPPGAWAAAALIERISGTLDERRSVLGALARLRPRALVLVCNAAATPDRGTERFLREACAHAGHCALWLADPPAGRGQPQRQRWRDWLDAAGLQGVASFAQPTDALAWAEQHHDHSRTAP